MMTTTLLSYYACQGRVTDPREHADLFDDVPCDVPALCRLAQGLVLHVGWASAYGVELTDTSRRELSIRSVAEQLRVIRTADPRPLPAPRPVASRMLGTCRAGEADPTDCGQQAATGLWFMRVNVVRDLLALAKTEISPWDGWRHISPAKRTLDDTVAALTDELARMPSDADRLGMPVRLPAEPTGELTPPWSD
jgi:hypothetical protein